MATTTAAKLSLTRRPRRLRRTESIRSLVRETRLTPDCFILPLFVVEGSGVRREVPSMPGVFQLSVDMAVEEAAAAREEHREPQRSRGRPAVGRPCDRVLAGHDDRPPSHLDLAGEQQHPAAADVHPERLEHERAASARHWAADAIPSAGHRHVSRDT